MTTGLASLVESGTKVWSDSVEPEVIERDLPRGITGATSNPVIVADLIDTGRFDRAMRKRLEHTAEDHELAWRMTDQLVRDAQQTFASTWEQTGGNDGYVSFELDPLLEDPERAAKFRIGHKNGLGNEPGSEKWEQGLNDTREYFAK